MIPAPTLVAIVETREEPHAELYRVYEVKEGQGLGDEPLFPGIWSQERGKMPCATPQKLMVLELDAIFVGEDAGVKRYRL